MQEPGPLAFGGATRTRKDQPPSLVRAALEQSVPRSRFVGEALSSGDTPLRSSREPLQLVLAGSRRSRTTLA